MGSHGAAGEPPAVFSLFRSLDARISPKDADYTAPTGAASITMVEQKLQQVNNNTQTFTVTPPSAGCVIQKNVMYVMNATVEFTSSAWKQVGDGSGPTPYIRSIPNGALFPVYGQDFAIAEANPLNALVTNWQCQINNATVQFNNQGNQDLVHLMTTPAERASKGVTTRTPLFASWDDGYGTTQGIGTLAELQGSGDVPPGAYEIQWVLPTGWTTVWGFYLITAAVVGPVPVAAVYGWVQTGLNLSKGTPLGPIGMSPPGGDVYTQAIGIKKGLDNAQLPIALLYDSSSNTTPTPTPNAVGISVPNGGSAPAGLPCIPLFFQPANIPLGIAAAHVSQYAFNSTLVDTMQCPPFGWTVESGYLDQGMWGVNNMLITAQLTDPGQARWLQGTRRGGMQSLNYTSWQSNAASLWFTYLSPSTTTLEVLPPRCVLPQMYKQVTTYSDNTTVQPGAFNTVTVPSYTFSTVSDVLMISVRPTYSAGNILPDGQTSATSVPFYETSFCATFPSQAFSQFQYANIPGVLSNLAAHQLVSMSRKNGSTASVAQYGGLVGSGLMMLSGVPTYSGGSVILLRPGTDFALPMGISPGSMGNIQLQYTLQFRNQGSRAAVFTVTTTSLSTGFFVLDNGAARQVMVGLNSKALMSADLTQDQLAISQLTGGGFLGTLASFAAKHLGGIGRRMAKGAASGAANGAANGMFGHSGHGEEPHGGATAGSGMGGKKRQRGSLFEALSRR